MPESERMETTYANEALREATQRALAYVQSVRDRPVTASAQAVQRLDQLKHPLPRSGLDAGEVVRRLDEIGSPATIATSGGRYFGLVIGGALPATVAANWLATARDQNACFRGFEILNDVVLNQVLVSFGSPGATRAVIGHLQAGGVCWCGGTVWQGRTAMRISVSNWATTDADVQLSVEAMVRATEQARKGSSA
jgi:hypothetical protein